MTTIPSASFSSSIIGPYDITNIPRNAHCIFISNTQTVYSVLKTMLDAQHIYSGYVFDRKNLFNEKTILNFMQEQKDIIANGKTPHLQYIIFDSFKSDYALSDTLTRLFSSAEELYIKIIITINNPTSIPSHLREYVDYYITLGTYNDDTLRALYNQYFSNISSFSEFSKIWEARTFDGEWLVNDIKTGTLGIYKYTST